jgi:uncharacterized membrane protein
MEYIDVLSRWLHIGTVIVLVGGSAFMRFALMPAAAELPEEQHQALRERIFARWRKIVMIGIALILISGLYNFVRALPHLQDDNKGLYHGLIGTKILLALVVFFLASALVGRSEKFEPVRQNAKKWLGILLLLAAIIVGISGYAKVAIPRVAAEQTEQAEE